MCLMSLSTNALLVIDSFIAPDMSGKDVVISCECEEEISDFLQLYHEIEVGSGRNVSHFGDLFSYDDGGASRMCFRLDSFGDKYMLKRADLEYYVRKKYHIIRFKDVIFPAGEDFQESEVGIYTLL